MWIVCITSIWHHSQNNYVLLDILSKCECNDDKTNIHVEYNS